MEVQKVAKKQEIQDEKEEIVKSKEETKKLVPLKFHKQIHVFRKKASKQILIKKIWDHAIELKEGFIPREKKSYSLLREKRGKMCKFIDKQLRKEYIRLSVVIMTLYSTSVCLMFAMTWTCVRVCFIFDLYLLCFASFSCSNRNSLMFSLFSLLKDVFLLSHSLQVYIVVDTILYLYTLPIDYLFYFYSSLCLSYNLSQAQDCNTFKVIPNSTCILCKEEEQ